LVLLAGDPQLRIAEPGLSGRHYAVYGPYVALPKGLYRAELQVTGAYCNGAAIDVCCESGNMVLAARSCTTEDMMAGLIHCDFAIPCTGVEDLEVRLSVPSGFIGTVEKLSILALLGA
jgi:hypothetical protein